METLQLPTSTAGLAPSAAEGNGWRTALRVLYRVNPILATTGWLNVVLAVAAVAALLVDHRVVAGAPVWLKPLKFALSITVYSWSLGWLLADLPAAAQRAVRYISWGTLVCMVVEQGIIFLQAGRGLASHYNTTTLLDGVLFGLMGAFIAANTALIVWALYLVWRFRPHGSAGYVWGVRWGLLLLLLGSALGGMMVRLGQHTVGAPDGGPGLPGLGWSTRAGDVRVAHFIGLHALQVLPLLGWALGRWVPRRAALLTSAGALLYAALVAGLFWRALQGQPL